MVRNVSEQLAFAAVNFRRMNPAAPALDVLDACLKGCTGKLADFGACLDPATPFGELVAEAFIGAASLPDWRDGNRAGADPRLTATLLKLWTIDVLPRLAARYGLGS